MIPKSTIRSLADQGLSVWEAAAKLGVSEGAIRARAYRLDIEFVSKPRSLTKAQYKAAGRASAGSLRHYKFTDADRRAAHASRRRSW